MDRTGNSPSAKSVFSTPADPSPWLLVLTVAASSCSSQSSTKDQRTFQGVTFHSSQGTPSAKRGVCLSRSRTALHASVTLFLQSLPILSQLRTSPRTSPHPVFIGGSVEASLAHHTLSPSLPPTPFMTPSKSYTSPSHNPKPHS